MCGRFFIKENTWDDVNKQFPDIQVSENKAFDITPAMNAGAITEGLKLQNLKWGFDGFDGKLLINARAEGIESKQTFAESIQERRCVLPASGFYGFRDRFCELCFERGIIVPTEENPPQTAFE